MDNTTPNFSVGSYLLPQINPEGKKFSVVALALAILVLVASTHIPYLGYLVLPLFALAYGVYLFFRDPERTPPDDANAILSPADGRICLIQEVPLPAELDGKEDEKFWRVSIFMSVFNVHVNRFPFAGTIIKKAYVPGQLLNASLEKASTDNERCAYLVETLSGVRYAVVQVAGLVARRIVPFVDEGAVVQTAERFGLIRFGSRLDVYLPKGVKPEVRLGQIMVSGETILGHII